MIHKKFFFLILIFHLPLLFFNSSTAQTPQWSWARSVGNTGADLGFSIAVDAAGNNYTAGYFEGTVDFDPGTGVSNLTSVIGRAVFVSKSDSAGNFIWAKAMTGNTGGQANSMVLDVSGNVYVCGYFEGTMDFDPGAALLNLTSNGEYDIFVVKLDSSGTCIWAKSSGGIDDDLGYSVAVDDSGNVYTTGYFQATVDFDPGTPVFNLTAAGGYEVFIQKLDINGDFAWTQAMGSTGNDGAYFITIGPGNSGIYTTGFFSATVDFDPDVSGTYNLTSQGSRDIFIRRLSMNGEFIWAAAMGSTSDDGGYSVAINPDGSGEIFATGFYINTVDFDPDTATFPLTSNGARDIFIVKLDSGGHFMWAGSLGGPDDDRGYDLVIGDSGSVYIAGLYTGTVDFDPGPGSYILTTPLESGIYIMNLTNAGAFAWAKGCGGTNQDGAHSITSDPSGAVYMTGTFWSASVSFDSIVLTNSDITGTTPDIFYVKLASGSTVTGTGESEDFSSSLLLYPNPAIESFRLDLLSAPFGNITVHIYDVSGKAVFSETASDLKQFMVPVNDFSPGIYAVVIRGVGMTGMKKLIIAR